VTDILAAIGCQQCGGSLAGSPSGDFCSDLHQRQWHEARADPKAVLDSWRPDQHAWTDGNVDCDCCGLQRPVHVGSDLASAEAAWEAAWEPNAAVHRLRGSGEPPDVELAIDLTLEDQLSEALDRIAERMERLAEPAREPESLTPQQRALELRRTRDAGPQRRERPPRTLGRPT
jgi:hypothetical protein